MDLAPFGRINPCGYAGLAVTQVRDLAPAAADPVQIGERIAAQLAGLLGQPLVAAD
jgi:lipoyl(octanoyl) transferase